MKVRLIVSMVVFLCCGCGALGEFATLSYYSQRPQVYYGYEGYWYRVPVTHYRVPRSCIYQTRGFWYRTPYGEFWVQRSFIAPCSW
jgi:hypothetical protein